MRAPNDYQTISDFLLNAVRSLYLTGNTYAMALRNHKYEIDELHLFDANQSSPNVIRGDHEASGEIFYALKSNDVIEARLATNERWMREQLLVPARDVLHIRLHSNRSFPRPLVGETPLAAAFGDMEMYERMKSQQEQFLQNRAAPSAVLSTDLNLDGTRVQMLRDRWNEGLHAGGTPILTHGLRIQPWTTPAPPKDLQLAELLQLTDQHIALVFRIPLQILGLGSAPLGSTETLMQFWLASGLGFAINHVELAFDKLFGLSGPPEDYTEFNTDALLRLAQKDRIEALARGVQTGIYSPNEARNQEGYDDVAYGDEPRVQQKVVSLSAAGSIPPAPLAPPAAAPVALSKDYQAAVSKDIEALTVRA